jgi:hypothetical protein
MNIPGYMRKPLSTVCHPRNTVADARRAIELDAKLQRKAAAPRETLQAFTYLIKALKKVEDGTPLAVALNLGDPKDTAP